MAGSDPIETRDRGVTAPSCTDFEAVYSTYFEFVWRCLRGLGVAPASLDDAAQEVFMVVLRREADLSTVSSIRGWLYGILRNVAHNQRRSQKRRSTEALSSHPDPPSQVPNPHRQAESQEIASFAEAFLAGLDESKQQLFVLAMLEEISVPEVAAMLEIPLNTAYSRLRTVRLEFRAALRRKQFAP